MTLPLTLYYTRGSPPARACLLLARYLELDIEIKEIDILSGEHRNEEFSKINPQKKIPVLTDGDFLLRESRAILAYLVNSRKPGSSLYPTDPKERAIVDQHLYYDATVVFPGLALLVRPILLDGEKIVPEKTKDSIRDFLKFLDVELQGKTYIAGNNLTIADFSLLGSITSFHAMGYDLSGYSNLNKWFLNLETLPGFEENQAGAEILANHMKKFVEGALH